MGWLSRRGNWYFYKYVRRGGRVRAVYCGNGPAAELAILDIEERKAARRAAASEAAECRRLKGQLIHVGRQMDLLVRATLVCEGYYQHHRSEWRRRRSVKKKRVFRPPATKAHAMQVDSSSLADLVKSANAGNTSAVQSLRDVLDRNPEVWRQVGDLARHAEEMLLKRIAREHPFLLECVKRHANDLRKQIGEGGPVLERLATERIVFCWLELSLIDAEYPGGATGGIAQARYVQTAKSAAQKRFDAAVRSLLLIRDKLGTMSRNERPKLDVVPFECEQESDEPPAAESA